MYIAGDLGNISIQQPADTTLSSATQISRAMHNTDMQLMPCTDPSISYSVSGPSSSTALCSVIDTVESTHTSVDPCSMSVKPIAAHVLKDVDRQTLQQIPYSPKHATQAPVSSDNNTAPMSLSDAVCLHTTGTASMSPYASSSEVSTLTYGTTRPDQSICYGRLLEARASPPVVSAVEAARLRAQKQAEWYANNRKDSAPGKQTSQQENAAFAKERVSEEPEHLFTNTNRQNVLYTGREPFGDGLARTEQDASNYATFSIRVGENCSDTTKQDELSSTVKAAYNCRSSYEGKRSLDTLDFGRRPGIYSPYEVDIQNNSKSTPKSNSHHEEADECIPDEDRLSKYKRRLAMNRESAAISRVRRRAYIKELEERLASVEAEKFQLVGKLEAVMQQNVSMANQLDNLFLLVATGQHPTARPAPSTRECE